jgi:tetratricopeptide (TPR) repeat protein
VVLPDKERNQILRLKQKPSQNDVSMAESDLHDWQSSIQQSDAQLRKGSAGALPAKALYDDDTLKKRSRPLPPVRGTKSVDKAGTNMASSVPSQMSGIESVVEENAKDDQKEKRISGYDFRAWERFDAEEAASMVEREESLLRENEVQRGRQEIEKRRKAKEEDDKRRRQTHKQEMERVWESLRASEMSELQIKTRAEREKQKGNEHFRAGEFDAALDCYTKSLALDPSNHIVHANRAVVYMKLDKLDAAEDDCTRSLGLDRNYVKAWSRRGMTRFRKGRYGDAADDFETGLSLQPDSKEIQSLLDNAVKKYNEVEGKAYKSKSSVTGGQNNATVERSSPAPRIGSPASTFEELVAFVAGGSGAELASGSLVYREQSVTRVTIIEEDDDDGSEEGESAEGRKEVPTRIAIVEENDDDDDECELVVEQSVAPVRDNGPAATEEKVLPGVKEEVFTRVPIVDEEESDSEDSTHPKSDVAQVDDTRLFLQRANQLKERGNDALKANNVREAIARYTEALSQIGACSKQSAGETTEAVVAVSNNRAMAFLSDKQYESAIADCSTVINHQTNNCKALYRRAICWNELGEQEKALADIDTLLTVEPKNPTARSLKEKIESAINARQGLPSSVSKDVAPPAEKMSEELPTATTIQDKNHNEKAGSLPPSPPDCSLKTSLEEAGSEFVCDEWTTEQRRQKILILVSNGQTQEAFSLSSELTSSLSVSDADRIGRKNFVSVFTLHVTVCFLTERWPEAISATTQILLIDPNNCRALIKRADAKAHVGDVQSAKTDLLAALRIDSTNTEAMGLLDMVEQQISTHTVSLDPHPGSSSSETFKAVTESREQPASHPPSSSKQQPSDRERAVALKEEGNEAIKAGGFKRAVELYSQSLALDATSAATYSNRAQAYLKLCMYADAEKDATAAMKLVSNDQTDKLYHKALYRRANARKSMGGNHLAPAVQDYQKLCTLDPQPTNKKELEHAKMLLTERESSTAKTFAPSTASAPGSSAGKLDAGGIGLSAVKTTMKKRESTGITDVPVTESLTPVGETGARNSDPLIDASSATPAKGTTKGVSTPTSASSSAKKLSGLRGIDVPTEPPKTLYELERIWRSMKDRPDLFAKYLSVFKKSTFKKVAKESLSSELLTCLFIALRDHASKEVVHTVLEGLSQSSAFAMMITLLPEDDMLCLQSIFAKLLIALDGGGNTTEIMNLKRLYGVA